MATPDFPHSSTCVQGVNDINPDSYNYSLQTVGNGVIALDNAEHALHVAMGDA